MNGPISPEELERARLYYGGDAGVNMSSAAPPADPTAYFGPPAPPAPPPVEPFTVEAPGGALTTPWGPVGPAAPPAPAVDMAKLRAQSANQNAETQGAPPKPAASPVETAAAKALAYYGGASGPGKPKSSGGGGGGGAPRGPGEYATGVAGLRATYGEDKGALQRGASTEESRADLISEGGAQIARTKMDDEAIQRVEAANAKQHFDDFSAETQRQIDDVRTKTIQPNRAYSDSGAATAAVIGGVLGGMYQGLNKLASNPFIDQMNKTIDRDIAAQETDLRTKKEAIGERKGLLAEMRATYKDEALAKLQAKNLYYEGAKEELAAQAAQYDSPAIQARADQAITAMTREQVKLDINEAIRKAAAANAAASAAEHRRQVDFENRLKLQDMQNKTLTAAATASKDMRSGGDKVDEQTAHLATELSKPELINAKKTIDDLKRKTTNPATGEVDGSKRIPGTGQLADVRAHWLMNPVIGAADNPITGLNPEERQGRLEWDRLFDAYRVAVTGAGAGEGEIARLKTSFQGANTPAEQAAAIRLADDVLSERESRIRAGAPREAVQKYDAQLGAERSGRPKPVAREPVK